MSALRPFFCLFSFLLLAICGCTSPKPVPLTAVLIAPNLMMTMPSLNDVGRSLEVTQLVTVHYQKDQFVFEGHISITPDRFLMVGLDAFGRKAITISWTKAGVLYESAPFVPSQLHPENILADIVLLYWPESSLRQALEGSPARLIMGKDRRLIMHGDKKILEVHYQPDIAGNLWNGQLHYRHFAWGYGMNIQSVEVAP